VTGCEEVHNYSLIAENDIDIIINQTTDIECTGNIDGAATFTIEAMGTYDYEIVGAGIIGSANGTEMVTINGLSAGGFVILITNTNSGCQSTQTFTINQNAPYQVIAVASPPSGCDTGDAKICINIDGDTGPYSLTANMGDIPIGNFETDICIENLINGIVNFTITDANGCALDTSIELDYPTIEDISPTDVSLTHLTCPDETIGSITSNTSIDYMVKSPQGVILGTTPLSNLEAGVYTISHTQVSCVAELQVEITAPSTWDTPVEITPVDCSGANGSITINIANPQNYLFNWSDNETVTNQAVNLFADIEYAVTITHVGTGCTQHLNGLIVEIDCETPEEPFPLITDTLFFTMPINGALDICLPPNELIGIPDQISICEMASNGNVSIESIFCLSYEPDQDFLGQDIFCAILCDDLGLCDTTIIVIDIEERALEIFNGFSPNNDGVNDVFYIKNIEYFFGNHLTIFNRWGNKVYTIDNYQNDWQGKYRSSTLPDGSYYYVLNDGKDNIYKGVLVINR